MDSNIDWSTTFEIVDGKSSTKPHYEVYLIQTLYFRWIHILEFSGFQVYEILNNPSLALPMAVVHISEVPGVTLIAQLQPEFAKLSTWDFHKAISMMKLNR